MKDRKRRQTLSGAVLIMVLTVMFVLIILLMATLTVVTTANQRIYTKYEENQAYYTARSALDVFSQNLLSDSTHYAVDASSNQRTYDYTDDEGNEQTSPMKQGLALEFELYKIRSKNDAGYASNFLSTDGIFGGAPEDDNYSTETVYNAAGGTYDPFDDTKHDSIVYTVTLPTLSDGSNSYGKLVDTDASGQKATIRVEVVERHYDYGGACKDAFKNMTDAELKTCSAGSVTYNSVNYTAAQLKDAISKGNRQKDRMRLKITSNATFIDTLGTAVLIYDVTEAPKTNSSQAITSMGGVTGSSGTFAIGGASALSDVSTIDNSVLVGDLYVDGNFTMVNSTDYLYFFKDTVYTIRGNWNIDSNSGYGKLAFRENGTVIYVTGTLSLGDAATFASPSAKSNVVADRVTMTGNGTHSEATYNGNFYCNTFEVATDNDSGPTVNGNVYANNIIADAFGAIGQNSGGDNVIRISDSLLCLSKVTVSDGIIIGGNKYTFTSASSLTGPDPANPGTNVTFTLEYGSTDLSIDADPSATNKFTYNHSAAVKMDYTDSTMYTMTSENKKQFTLPADLAGKSTNKIEVPTAAFLYNEIFQPSTFLANAPDDGKNGEIDPNKPEYPEFEYTILDPSGVTVYRDGSLPYDPWWGPVAVSPKYPGLLADIAKGNITDANDPSYPGDWSDFSIDKEFATEALKLAKANDTDYQQALADFYAVYITGAEKANESQSDLKVFSSEVSVRDVSDYDTDTELQTIATDINASQVINSSGYIGIGDQKGTGSKSSIQSNTASPVIIDARTAPITLQLGNGSGSGSFRGYYVVIGDQPVKVYLPDGIDDYTLGNTASGQGFFISTYDIYKEMGSTGTLKLGDDPNAMPSPNIFFYAGDNVKSVTVYSEDSFISGHIYFPFASYKYDVNDGYKFSSVTYNTFPITMTGGFHCIGSLICGSYQSGNKTGVAYISQDNSSYNAGEPQFHWLTTQYARN